MPAISTGKVLLSLTSFWSGFGCYHFDWNETHIYNPNWPPHAKFHNAQTMSMGAALGAAGLYTLWGQPGSWGEKRLQVAAAAASMYWVTQLSSILYPGTALFDGPWPRRADDDPAPPAATAATSAPVAEPAAPPRVRGPQTVVASVCLTLNVLAYALETRRLARTAS